MAILSNALNKNQDAVGASNDLGVQGTSQWNFVQLSVIDFLTEFGIPAWNGYRYWAAYTSQELNYWDIPENVYLEASNDNQNWFPIDAANTWNPSTGTVNGSKFLLSIYEESPGVWARFGRNGPDPTHGAGEYRAADPALAYDKDNDQLVVFYSHDFRRASDGAEFDEDNFIRTISNDLTISEPISVGAFTNEATWSLFLRAGTWYLFAVNNIDDKLSYHTCLNDGNWNFSSAIDILTNVYDWMQVNLDLSHFEIEEDAIIWNAEFRLSNIHENLVDVVITSYEGFNLDGMSAYHWQLNFSNLAAPIVNTDQPLWVPGTPSFVWDSGGMYRPSIIPYVTDANTYGLKFWHDAWREGQIAQYLGFVEGALSPSINAIWSDCDRISGSYDAGDQLTLTGNGNQTSIRYRWDGGGWTTYTVPIDIQEGLFEWQALGTNHNQTVQWRNFNIRGVRVHRKLDGSGRITRTLGGATTTTRTID